MIAFRPIIDTIVPINLAGVLWALKSRFIPPRAHLIVVLERPLFKVTTNNAPIINTTTIVPKHLARDCSGLSSPDLIQALAFSSFGTMVNYVHREYNEF